MKIVLFLLLILISFTTIDSALGHPDTIDTHPPTYVPKSNEYSKTFFQEYFIISLIIVIVVSMTITASVIYREELLKPFVRNC